MKRRDLVLGLLVLWVFGVGRTLLWAQQAPDLILYNGKVVTADDHAVNANLGTIAQAVAVRGDQILAVGANAQIRALAGPNTKSLDLKGRTVLPGMGVTHDHPMDWDPLNPLIVKKVISDDMHIERFLSDPPDQQIQEFPRVLQEAVQKAKPGQWIRIGMLYGKEYRGRDTIEGAFGRQITKEMLDSLAPNNPVVVRAGFVGVMVNQKAIDAVNAFYKVPGHGGSNAPHWGPLSPNVEKTGVGGVEYRGIEQDVLYDPQVLREMYRLGTSWWAGYGLTVNSSAVYTASALVAYTALDRNGQMDIRIPWSWLGSLVGSQRTSHFDDPYLVAGLNALTGRGSDYLWMIGVWPAGMGTNCTTLPGTSPEVKQQEPACNFAPGTKARETLYNHIRGGGRFTGMHTGGDKDIDYVLEIIEQASKDAGMTAEEIRAKRHAYDHLGMNPRPDQIPRLKNLGMMVGGWDLYIYEGSGQKVLKDYGEQAAQWVVPRKNLLDAGVRESTEIDRPIGYTDLTFFNVLYVGITRKDQDGKITAPAQAVGREAMLKSATLSAAYYALREDKLGSIERGKLADLVVLDKDYLTIPVDDIPKIRVLMTMLGGKVVHLVPSLARELGMAPTGSQVTLGGSAAQW